jgi:pentapeptide MXKDX repeat protein
MRRVWQMIAAVVVGVGLSVAIAGCGSETAPAKDKMTVDNITVDRMSGDKMSGDKMHGGKMGDNKMDSGKMEDGKKGKM